MCFLKRTLRYSLGLTIGLFLLVAILVSIRVVGKGAAIHSDYKPQSIPKGPVPQRQFESHTCGLHALESLYEAYNYEPWEENLRVRLGVDVSAVPGDGTTTGTLQPDMLRVLAQDYFKLEVIGPEMPGAVLKIAGHLKQGNLAVLLIARRENGNLHWVLAGGDGGETMVITDSLAIEPYLEPFPQFFFSHVVSAILVQPCGGEVCHGSWEAHSMGVKDLYRCRERIAEIQKKLELAQAEGTPKI